MQIILIGLAAILAAAAITAISRAGWRRHRGRSAAGPITLGGRSFTRIPVLSVARDEAFMDLVLTAGLEYPDILPGEDHKACGERIFCALHRSGVMRPMVACLIVPTGTPAWTPGVADQTSAFLATLDTEADKQRYYALVAELLLPFYRSGLASWAASRACGASSLDNGSTGPASSPAPAPATGGA